MTDDEACKQQRVLIHAPFGRDATLAATALQGANLHSHVCQDLHEVVRELRAGAAALLSVEEALPLEGLAPLLEFLQAQPTWSDLPVLVLTKAGSSSPWVRQVRQRLGNLTLLERPLRASTLVSATQAALRARLRQYHVRTADQRKDEFLAMLAHELRNPLAPISAAVQLMQLTPAPLGGGNNDADRRMRHATEVIARQVEHMKGLIDDLLDVARVTRGLVVLERKPHDLRRVLAEALEQCEPLVRQRGHRLVLDQPAQPAMVAGDHKRLVQVACNLLNNACKYTPERGEIRVSLQLAPETVTLEVADNGIGMAPELVGRVFEMFAQAERTSDRAQGGLGLGLALVDKLVAFHGGKVSAASDGAGQGSRFTVSLPRYQGEAGQSPSAAPWPDTAAAKASLRVMVVDDNTDAADMLEALLEAHGYEVAVEYSGQRALQRAPAFAPQVCLLDIGLPDMDGNVLAQRLRDLPETRGTLLLAVTGYGQRHDSQAALAAGFDEHWVKPVDIDKLLARLSQVAG